MMEGRRYSEGCTRHSKPRSRPYRIGERHTRLITFQNYFRLYGKLAGMTGTALTEAAEFMDIYSLDVIEIPTNMPWVASTPMTRSTERSTRKSAPL